MSSASYDPLPTTTLPIQDHQWISPPVQTPFTNESSRIIFTRQLWQRIMPEGDQNSNAVLNESQAQETRGSLNITTGSSRRTSSAASSRSSQRRRRRSPSPPSARSQSLLTPEESPPFRTTRKRTAGIVEVEDKDLDDSELSPAHTRSNSGDSIPVCICQPEPKIPRPRNAFILYRQQYQAQVVAQNSGLSNPEISKIIGEQWQNQSPEIKNKWKALAEEEKLRHQQQYPTYRYQPKRSGRRNSLSSDVSRAEKPLCSKCGGRSILAPSSAYSNVNATSPASVYTPGFAVTPLTRTLPQLRDLSLQSPASRRMGKQFPHYSMSPVHHVHPDERNNPGPLSPELKRRRYNGEVVTTLGRPMAPRYATGPPAHHPVGPGTPFPFGPGPPHPYPLGAPPQHLRRESLPGLRGVVSPPGPMGPPPRPGAGYQQHRLSQGHNLQDRSLILPPLQTGYPGGPAGAIASAGGSGLSVKDHILHIDFWYKVKVLSQVAPPKPVTKSAPRGPFIAVEGDDPEVVRCLASWLTDMLSKGDDLKVTQLDGPRLSSEGSKEEIMAQYHQLAAYWLLQTREVVESLLIQNTSPTDSVTIEEPKASNRTIDENYDQSEEPSGIVVGPDDPKSDKSSRELLDSEQMDVDSSASISRKESSVARTLPKPVSIVANFSLHASNFFACHIPIESHGRYSPKDHWEWTATQWRGVISPDLTIYVRDMGVGEHGKASVEMMDEGNVFVVKRGGASKEEGKKVVVEVEPATLRRLGFEASEWVRAFGQDATTTAKMEE